MKTFYKFQKLLCITVFICTFLNGVKAQNFCNTFTLKEIGTDIGNNAALSICTDLTNEIKYVAGVFSGTINVGHYGTAATAILNSYGQNDIYLVAYKVCDNTVLWANVIGGINNDNTAYYRVKIKTDGTNVLLTGSVNTDVDVMVQNNYPPNVYLNTIFATGYQNDIIVASFNSTSGLQNFAKTYGSLNPEETGGDIIIDGSNCYITGLFYSTVTFGTLPPLTSYGGSDVFLLKLDYTTGVELWARHFGSTNNDLGTNVIVGESGYIYTSGICQLGGSSLLTFPAFNVSPYWGLINLTKTNPSGVWGSYIGKVDEATGNFLWANQMTADASGIEGTSAFIDFDDTHGANNGILYMSGITTGNSTIYDRSGSNTIVSSRSPLIHGIYLTAFNINGTFYWSPYSYNYGSSTGTLSSYLNVQAIKVSGVSSNSSVYIIGNYNGTTDILGTSNPITSNSGSKDGYIAEINVSSTTIGNPLNFYTIPRNGGDLADLGDAGDKSDDYFFDASIDATHHNIYLAGRYFSQMDIGLNSLNAVSNEPIITTLHLSDLNISGSVACNSSVLTTISAFSATSTPYTFYDWFYNDSPIQPVVGAMASTYSATPIPQGRYTVRAHTRYCNNDYEVANLELFPTECNSCYKNCSSPTYYGSCTTSNAYFTSNFSGGEFKNSYSFTSSVVPIVFDGTITIDAGATVTLTSCNVVMMPCSKIVVLSGGTLIIDQSIVRGCKRWLGIEAQPGSSVTITGNVTTFPTVNNLSTISDALVALYANDATIKVDHTIFQNNHLSIGLENIGSSATSADISVSAFWNMDNSIFDYCSSIPTPFSNYLNVLDYININNSKSVTIHDNGNVTTTSWSGGYHYLTNVFEGEFWGANSIGSRDPINPSLSTIMTFCKGEQEHEETYGIYASASSDLHISNNLFRYNMDAAIKMVNCSTSISTSINVNTNWFYYLMGKEAAMHLESCSGITLQLNSFSTNKIGGIYANNCEKLLIDHCSFDLMGKTPAVCSPTTYGTGIYLNKVTSYNINSCYIYNGDKGIESYNDQFVTNTTPFPHCLINQNYIHDLNFGLIISPVMNPINPNANSGTQNLLSTKQDIAILCNNFNTDGYGIIGSGFITDQFNVQNPGNTFTLSTYWDLVWADANTLTNPPITPYDLEYLDASVDNVTGHTYPNITLNGNIVTHSNYTNYIHFTTGPSGMCDYGPVFSPTFTGINKLNKLSVISIYPNPGSQDIHIEGIAENTSYTLYDIFGKNVLSGNLNTNNDININNLSSGVYLIKLDNSKGTSTMKFVKE